MVGVSFDAALMGDTYRCNCRTTASAGAEYWEIPGVVLVSSESIRARASPIAHLVIRKSLNLSYLKVAGYCGSLSNLTTAVAFRLRGSTVIKLPALVYSAKDPLTNRVLLTLSYVMTKAFRPTSPRFRWS